MEANLFIKSYKTEGNKITDLKFYGDMEIDIGEGPVEVEVLPRYKETRLISANTFPYGTSFGEVRHENGKYYFKLRNDAPWSYFVVINSPGGTPYAELPSGKSWAITMSDEYVTTYHGYIYAFDKTKEHCVGIIHLNDFTN